MRVLTWKFERDAVQRMMVAFVRFLLFEFTLLMTSLPPCPQPPSPEAWHSPLHRVESAIVRTAGAVWRLLRVKRRR